VFVSTHTGAIYCFEPASKGAASALTISDPAAAIRLSVLPFAALKTFATAAFAKMIEQLHQGGMDRGFALVVGDADGKFSTALAAKTQLRVVNALADETAATALREWVLANSTLHGTRVHVQTVKRLDQLPFAQFFANAVIVAGPAPGLSPKELYRVLHPCGGMLLTPGLKTAEAETFLKNSGAIDSEIRQALGGADQADKSVRFTDGFIVRGKLPGALDWDSAVKSDQRVKWPLRPLWFGGPSTRQVQNDVEGAPGPVVANGRYFMRSERVLTAVDAYNGAVLWSRPIPEAWPSIREVDGVLYRVSDAAHGRPDRSRSLRANNENVYLGLGAEFFQGQGEGTIELDARTGEQKKVYGTFNPPAPVVPLKTAQTWPLAVDANQSGVVAMESTSRGLVLTLTTKDTSITRLDAWELLFDFRPVEVRYGLYERGAFHIRVTPAQGEKTPASWSLVTGPEHPKLDVAGTRDAAGTKTTVILPWAELEKWIGAKPASFDFAATLNAHAGGRDEPIVRRHLFGNWAADGINNGWARIVLDDSAPATGSTNAPAIIASMKDLKGAGLGAPGSIHFADKSVQESPGVHPLTGEPVPKVHGIAPVCGAAYCSANVISQSGALYDLADNSGRRSLQGTKTGCTTPQIAALGMMIISEEWGHCICNHPFRTSMALAPAERRLNEDWAQFYDRDVDTRLRQAYVNLGAPGDRRDEKGNLWLGFPRTNEPHTPEDYPNPDHPLPYPVGMRDAQTGLWNRRPIRSALAVPLEVETFAGFGPYRFNADRIPVQGTDRPWIYGSGYRGIRKATLKLNFFKPLASLPAQGAVAIDGKLDEPSWGNDMQSANSPARLLPYTGTRVLFRHDSQNLYVGMQRPPMTVVKRTARVGSIAGFTNEPRPWRVGDSKPDAVTDKDNWWRLIVSSDNGQRAAHFTVTPNGTRAGALYDGTRTNLDLTWKPAWQSAVQTNAQGWALEMAIPWSTLAAAGVQPNRVAVNFLMQDPGAGTEALTYLGMGGCDRCANFTPLGLGKAPAITPRQFTVRLHFAEPDDIKPGQRVFDVKLQNQVVLKGLDVVKEAGGVRTALVREFKNVPATEVMALEFIASGKEPTAASVPILSALEVYDEGFSPPVVAQKQSNQ